MAVGVFKTDGANGSGIQNSLTGSQQFLRTCNLVVSDKNQNGLDLSNLRIKFSVKRTDNMTPNTADIYVYNLEEQTALDIRDNFKKVILQGGYESNFGVIFQGNIKQVIIGRESGQDTFINIQAGDGDQSYNFAIVNQTIAAGATQTDQITAAANSMTENGGVTTGNIGTLPQGQLPRGKVMYGNARHYLRNVAQNTNNAWSIQDEQITFVPKKSYLPGQVTVLTSKTGMIGQPQQTNIGVNVKALLNPNIKVGGRIQIDNKSVQNYKINLSNSQQNAAANVGASLSADGTYYVMAAEYEGDTRGVPWYVNLVRILMSISSNPINSVQTDYGG